VAELLRVGKRGTAEAAGAAAAQQNSDAIRFVVSSDTPDIFGDVVVQRGLTFPARLPAVVDHDHRVEAQIGSRSDISISDHETRATLRLVPKGVSRVADLARALHEGGHGLASSVYFQTRPSDVEPIMRTDPTTGRTWRAGSRYTRGAVTEISLTPTPANAAAVAVARSLGFESNELAALLRTGAGSEARPLAPAVAASPPARVIARSANVDLSQLITQAEADATSAAAELVAATAAVDDANPETLQAVARCTTAANAAQDRLAVLRNAQAAAARAAAAAPQPGAAAAAAAAAAGPANLLPVGRVAPVTRRPQVPDVPAGTRLAQMAIARVHAHNSKRELNAVVGELFPSDHAIIAIARAATGVADTTTAGWAAELIRTEVRQMLEKDLAPISVAAALAVRGRRLNFLGAQSTVIPAVTTRGKATAGAWVGEGGVIPVKQGAFTAKRIYRYKLAAITTLTKELERASDPDAIATLREMMLQDTANALDGFLLDAIAEITGVRPAGLLNSVATTAGAAGGGQAAVDADLKTLWTTMVAAGAGSSPVLIINSASAINLAMMTNALGQYVFRDDIRANNLLGLSVIASTNVPALTATLVDAACFASAFDAPEVDVTDQATLTMADAGAGAPTQAMNAAGALGTAEQVLPDRGISVAGGVAGAASAGFQALSLFQTWSLGIRNVLPVGWGLTRAGAVQGVTAITW
jgi:hypothetical protein